MANQTPTPPASTPALGNKNLVWWIVGIIVLALIGWAFYATQNRSPESGGPAAIGEAFGSGLEVKFVNHLALDLPEQDVFVESPENKNQVIRFGVETAGISSNLSAPLFAAAGSVPHDPFKLGPNPLGPFAKGRALGFTMGKWLSATGGGTYEVTAGTARLAFNFTGLVPNGVYTVWCSRITFPPNFAVVDRPCGAPDGSQNSFTADANGAASFNLTMEPLEASSAETASAIALAYHSDGKTYGAEPGDFGLTSHVQIVWLLPAPETATAE